MSRRKSREVAMQTLFQLEMNKPPVGQEVDIDSVLKATWAEDKSPSELDLCYSKDLVDGVLEHVEEIDSVLENVSIDWKVSRMSGIDRNILRIAVFEIKWGNDDVNLQIAINEAVELAKKFGTDDSARFVNGILGAIVKA